MIGVAIGSQNSVIGVKKGGNVDIVLSSTSKRQVPTMSSVTKKERLFGEGSKEVMKSNINSTVIYPNRYLGLQPEWGFLEYETDQALAQAVVDDKTGRLAFNIDYKGEKMMYYPENIMGIFFNKLKHQWLNQGIETKDLCVTVPDYYTCNERVAMADSVKTADLNLISLINESSAICVNYGLFRRAQLDEKTNRLVCFVDMGHSSTSIIFGSFTKNNQKVSNVFTERNLGARDFDYALMKHCSNDFKSQYGCDPMKSNKCRIRMLDVISKARKILTGNAEASISVECLMDDEDLYMNLKREEFENIITPVINTFKEFVKSSLEKSKYSLSDIHSVEMVGDAVRTPIVQQVLKEIFNLEVSKTLAPDECIARGVTLFSAMSSPLVVIKDYTFEHFNNYTIVLEYPFVKDGETQIRTHNIIKRGDTFPSRKSIKFTEKQVPKDAVLNMKLSYHNDEVSFMKDNTLTTYAIGMPQGLKEEKFEFVLQFNLDSNGIPVIDKASVNEVWYEDAPEKENKDDKKKDDTKKDTKEENKMDIDSKETKKKQIKKERPNACTIQVTGNFYGLNRGLLEQTIEREKIQEKTDLELVAARNKRNEVENFIYGTRPKLDNELSNYVTPEDKNHLLALMKDVETWFYSGDVLIEDKATLDKKCSELDTLGNNVYKRFNEWEMAVGSVNNFQNSLNSLNNNLNDTNPTGVNQYLEEKDKEELFKTFDLYKGKLQDSTSSLSKGNRLNLPPVLSKDVNLYNDDFQKKVNQIYTAAENKVKEEKRKKEEAERKAKKEKEDKEKAEKAEKEKADKLAKEKSEEDKTKGENKQTEKTDVNMDVD